MRYPGSFLVGAILGALLWLTLGAGCHNPTERAEPAPAAPALSAPDQRIAAAQGELATAKADLAAAKTEKSEAQAAAAVAPLTAILHIAEGLALAAIILGVVDIMLSLIWTALPIGKLLGEGMIASGVATLLACGLLQGALNHARLILSWSAAALAVWGIVWLKRTGKLASVLGIAHDSYALAISALRVAGKHAEADAIEAGHALKVAEKDVAGWVRTLLVKLHVIKTVTTLPAAPAAPPAAPKV